MPLAHALEFFFLGVLVGAIGTLIGAGGGFLLVPLLLFLYPEHSASHLTAMSLAIVFFNAYAGTWAYARMNRIDYAGGIRFAIAGIPCALLGTWIVQLVPRRPFELGFGVTLLAIGVYLMLFPLPKKSKLDEHAHAAPALTDRELLVGSVGSAYLGLVSSLLGIGGGILHVPFLVRVLHYPPHRATATSHFVLAIVAFTGATAHVVQGDLNDLLAPTALIALGVMCGAPAGAAVSPCIRGKWIIRFLATALALVALRLLFSF